ncbi:MAG TPA: polysaccharide deacetylase family protein [Casimicrobiaceae bacterium]|nr:polysaccharide deacetylase family protein [Casimicrobiaceae bacterium]
MRTVSISAAIVATIVLFGCADAPQRPPTVPEAPVAQQGAVLARDDAFAIVVVGPGEDLATLAQRHLGDRGKRWWIAEFNNIDEVRPGQAVAIPLKPVNPTGVYANGFATVPILCYHRFGPRSSQLAVTPAAFEAQMDYLARNGYHVLSMSRFAGFLERGEPVPRKSVVLTIDDGYRSTYEVAFPILRKYGFPATVFLYSDFVGAPDALTWPQMKELQASGLIDIQPHSKTHSNLTVRLAGESDAKYRDRMRAEVEMPIRLIQDRLAEGSLVYAFPYGDVNETVVDLLKRQGVRLGVTVTPGGNGFFAYPYMLRRSMVFGGDSIDVFKSKLATFTQATPR